MLWVWGWYVLEEIIKNKSRRIFRIQVLKQHQERLMNILGNYKVKIEVVENRLLDKSFGLNHQGVAMEVSQVNFLSLKDWLSKQGDKSFLVACDLLNDPHNLGAIIRTSRAFGANGILVTKMKSAPFNGHLAKSSAGALESFPVVQVANLATSLEFLKDFHYKIYGLDHRGKGQWKKADRSVVVLGQEGQGLRDLTKKRCDEIIKIETQSDFAVLNVSVAAGIIIAKFLGG